MEAYKSYQVEGGKKGAELDVANLPENQAAALQSAAAKSGAEEQAKTDVKYFDTLYKGITGSGTIAAQQKQNIDILRQIADSKDFTPASAARWPWACSAWLPSSVSIRPGRRHARYSTRSRRGCWPTNFGHEIHGLGDR